MLVHNNRIGVGRCLLQYSEQTWRQKLSMLRYPHHRHHLLLDAVVAEVEV